MLMSKNELIHSDLIGAENTNHTLPVSQSGIKQEGTEERESTDYRRHK